MKAFMALSCLVAAVIADGPGGHHHPHPAPAHAVIPAGGPLHRGPAPFPGAGLAPIVAHPAPYRAAPLPYRPAPIPAYGPAPVPAYGAVPIYPDAPPAYDFGYGVQIHDYHGSANFGHNENRHGYNTNGEYHVDLPDGRTQIVTYTVDGPQGYVADVKYVNKAVPIVPSYGPAPIPAYPPAPVRPYGRVPALPAPVPIHGPFVA